MNMKQLKHIIKEEIQLIKEEKLGSELVTYRLYKKDIKDFNLKYDSNVDVHATFYRDGWIGFIFYNKKDKTYSNSDYPNKTFESKKAAAENLSTH